MACSVMLWGSRPSFLEFLRHQEQRGYYFNYSNLEGKDVGRRFFNELASSLTGSAETPQNRAWLK